MKSLVQVVKELLQAVLPAKLFAPRDACPEQQYDAYIRDNTP